MTDSTFIEPNYQLHSCQLRQLTQAEIIVVSQTLSKMEPWRTLNYSAEKLIKYLNRQEPYLHQFGIVVQQQVVGVICTRYPWLYGAYIELFAVYQSQQGQGIGHDIVNWLAIDLAQKSNLHNLWAGF